ncbi:Uncharacterised protein [Mycobacteroides abscessus subsp. abscessus]|nr:Uncharacterised protein [Mycobacteroides abscessus subsp. abscessus]
MRQIGITTGEDGDNSQWSGSVHLALNAES